MSRNAKLPVIFFSHGPGPAWLLDSSTADEACSSSPSAQYLHNFRDSVLSGYPPIRAVLVISAHWEEQNFTVLSTETNKLYYDYSNFPEKAYSVTWPVPGCPDVAQRTRQLLQQAGLTCAMNTDRGLDHGVFVPLKLVFSQADVPVLQVSLRKDDSVADHLRLGEVLAPLRDEGVLIVTSGHTTHNSSRRAIQIPKWATDFRDWIHDILTNPGYTKEQKKKALTECKTVPSFSSSHPTMDHFLPIPVALAASEYTSGQVLFEQYIMGGLLVSHYLFD